MRIELAVSLIALLIAGLSAIYARRSAVQAALANRISSHQPKSEILDSFLRFKGAFTINGEDADPSLFYSLMEAANRSNLYFTSPVSEHLLRYGRAAFGVLIARDNARRLESIEREVPTSKWDEIHALVDDCRSIEGDLQTQLESQTKLVN
jgi:hypothetical protein